MSRQTNRADGNRGDGVPTFKHKKGTEECRNIQYVNIVSSQIVGPSTGTDKFTFQTTWQKY